MKFLLQAAEDTLKKSAEQLYSLRQDHDKKVAEFRDFTSLIEQKMVDLKAQTAQNNAIPHHHVLNALGNHRCKTKPEKVERLQGARQEAREKEFLQETEKLVRKGETEAEVRALAYYLSTCKKSEHSTFF